ncbi:MAG: monovalent cation/H(+) antiporter subunit G [Desulfurococcus sp.]|jgi:multicomponent Na+:H+ antiporter subunit G|uniref:monovalent cation/H(+) antiporter subunit G n=1 Tax=Desulfurococcus sp. TaxID=51678 RepID=UPI00316629AB
MTLVEIILEYIGLALLCLGAIASLIGAIGMHRLRNFYLRLHAATVITIWGGVYPIVGASILAMVMPELGVYRWFMAGAGFVTAFIILILAPAGSHALARAVHRSRTALVEPCVYDAIDSEMCVKKEVSAQ